MKRSAIRLSLTLLSFTCVTLITTRSRAAGSAMVSVVEASGLTDGTLRTARMLVSDELRKRGISPVDIDRPPLDPVTPERAALARQHGVECFYELRLLPMGKKVIVGLAARVANSGRIERAVRLTAASVEELDLIVPRLVEALLSGQTVKQTQRVDTVTHHEGRRWRKRAGEFLWGAGLITGSSFGQGSGASYGAELRFAYEMSRVRLDFNVGGFGGEEARGHFDVGISAAYLFSTGNVSPFIGGGMRLLVLGGDGLDEQTGVGASATAGLELFRLYSVRLLAAGEVTLPFFSLKRSGYYDYELGYQEPEAGGVWSPDVVFKLTMLW